jgi:very-short-patch-repair endonuclease
VLPVICEDEMGKLDDRLMPVFAAQHWLVSRSDVRAAGGSWRQEQLRVQRGAWEVADEGVYRLAGAPQTWESRSLAPILAIGGRARASHHCAAALHGIPGFGEGAPEISIERGRGARREGVRIHTSTDLERSDPVVVRGVPCTGLPRTILDLARTSSDKRVLQAIEWGRRTERVDWSELISTLARHARRGRPGIRRLRRVITRNAHRAEISDSDFELLFLAFLAEHAVLEPVLHHRVFDGDRFVAEVDLAYPDLKIAIELDGRIHLNSDVRERDLPRQNDLVLAGWIVLRFTWSRFTQHPDAVLSEIREAIRRAPHAA